MKRDGYIMDEITDHSNISAAIDEVLSSSNRKNSAVGRDIIAHRDEEIEKIANELRSGHLDLSLYFQRDVFEHGKLRHLQVLPVRKRIAINAVMRVVDRHIRPRFIRTTGASIQGRGMHDLMAYIRDFETGIKTDQGDDRTLVAIEHNGEPKKFFTASIESAQHPRTNT